MKELSLEAVRPKRPENVFPVLLSPDIIGVLRQGRSTMSESHLEDLTLSIRKLGQKTPGLIVALTANQAKKYLNRVNKMWGVRHHMSEFTPVPVKEKGGEIYYFFLVAGHQRLCAVKTVGGEYLADLQFGGDFLELLQLQYHENTHEALSQDDEARFLTLLWWEYQRQNPVMTMTSFANEFRSTPEKVRKAIRFASLPKSLQQQIFPNAQFKKGVAYGMLCELARLQEAREEHSVPYTEVELQSMLYAMVVQYKTVKQAAAFVSEQIRGLQAQCSLFELVPSEALVGAQKTVRTGLERELRVGNEHLTLVATLHEGGVPRIAASGSTVSAVHTVLNTAEELAPRIIDGLRGAKRAATVRERLQS
ncbi:hypothetical protein KC902_01265 [Candidatus Kaiserbacteria bacterium]|nr:hypothetical protein [Candidatus Kaiserbacteria bacterium]USN88564.1 MAG: hypothetical protein H6780_03700 [Candidatus Nomurabacteria bacterium]